MKKKMVAMLLVLTMIGSLTGCGKTEDTGGNTQIPMPVPGAEKEEVVQRV